MSNTQKTFRMLVQAVIACWLLLPVCASVGGDLMRIVAPVRLTSEPGAKLDGEVAQARQILEKFQNAGYARALWVVDAMPEKKDAMQPWLEACLKAFPAPPVVALDAKMEHGKMVPGLDRFKLFLETARSLDSAAAGSNSQVRISSLPFHSVVINYTRLNNHVCADDSAAAMKAVRKMSEMVHRLDPSTFRWLLIGDGREAATASASLWASAFKQDAEGYFLYHPHQWNIVTDHACAEIGVTLAGQGKPLLRGGFRYVSPHPRPGLMEDIQADYNSHMRIFEESLAAGGGWSGYCRTIGEAIPGNVSPNQDWLGGDQQRGNAATTRGDVQ